MLNFDKRGNLKPYEAIPTTLTEMKRVFVDNMKSSDTRIENYVRFRKYITELKSIMPEVELKQWINGSFVTKKADPKDIDLITFIDHSIVKKYGTKLDNFRPDRSWDVFQVDAYILEVYPKNSPYYVYTLSDVAYWADQFGRTRVNRKGDKHPKGFLELIL